jgi:hypothetical protein
MPKTKISEFSATPANNTDIDSINIAEGCAPSGINDAIRELMAQLKDFQTGAVGDSFNGPIGTTTAAAGAFTTLSSTGNTTLGDASGDAITVNGTATFANANPTLTAGTANGVTYLNGSKVLTSGSALTFDGTDLLLASGGLLDIDGTNAAVAMRIRQTTVGAGTEFSTTITENTGVTFDSSDSAGATARSFIWTAAGTEGMRLTSTGLGIGTSSPSCRLDVSSSASRILNLNSTSANGYGMAFNNSGTDVAYIGSAKWNFSGALNDMSITTAGAYNLCFGTNTTERARIDSSGNFILGGTATVDGSRAQIYGSKTLSSGIPQQQLNIADNSAIATGAGGGIVFSALFSGSSLTTMGSIEGVRENGTSGNYAGALVFKTRVNGGNNNEAVRIDSAQNFLVGTTTTNPHSSGTYGTQINKIAGVLIGVNDSHAIIAARWNGNGEVIRLQRDNTDVGSIDVTTTATSYNTSSDYRLKNTIAPMTGALAKVALLKPCTYKWNANGSDGEGFIAHELAEVCPDAVTGAKDAVDAEGNPQYQGIDTSFLVATLTAALQELDAKFEAYKASHP